MSVHISSDTPLLRHDWQREELLALFDLPFPDLLHRAATAHRAHFDPAKVQVSTLLSVKTGGCPEDCAYCPQAQRYDTGVAAQKLMDAEQVLAKAAQASGGVRAAGPAQRRSLRPGLSSTSTLTAAPSRSSYWPLFSDQRKAKRPRPPRKSAIGMRKISMFMRQSSEPRHGPPGDLQLEPRRARVRRATDG